MSNSAAKDAARSASRDPTATTRWPGVREQ